MSLTGRGFGGGGLGRGATPQQAVGASGSLTSRGKQLWVGVGGSSVIIVFQANTMAEKIKNHPFVSFQSLVF